MRDLLGFELELIKDLPQDPVKPYHFNNTAEFMLLGPEQLDRYLKTARRAMASAIVDPGKTQGPPADMVIRTQGTGVRRHAAGRNRRLANARARPPADGDGAESLARDGRIPDPHQGRRHPAAGLRAKCPAGS